MINFIENNFTIIDPKNGESSLKLYDWQKEALKNISKNRIITLVTSRQIGSTTLLNLYALSYALKNPSTKILIIGSSNNVAETMSLEVQRQCIKIDETYKENMFEWSSNKRLIFRNKSTIHFLGQNPEGLRGISADIIICHDLAFYKNIDIFMTVLYPCLSVNYKNLILQSCPNGKNEFYNISKQYNNVYNYDWTSNPQFTESEMEERKKLFGKKSFEMEYECSFDEIEEKNNIINIRITNIEKEKMLKRAGELGFQSLSEYLRFVGLNADIKVEIER
jgi:hypothetical protein